MRVWISTAVVACAALACTNETNSSGPSPCDPYAASGAPRGTHDAVALILRGDGTPTNMAGSCAFSSCHTGSTPRATLDLTANPNITTALVNVPSCQAAGMVRVLPGDPTMSWLWIKLTGPYNLTTGAITFPATPQNCAHTDPPGTLGGSMPWTGGGMPIPLGDAQLFQICSWIEDGGLGP